MASLRVVGLGLLVALLSPINPLLLLSFPLAVLLVAFRPRDVLGLALAALILVSGIWGGARGASPMFLATRGWCLLVGGAFVAASMFGSRMPVTGRALVAVGAAFCGVGLLALVRPVSIEGLDRLMGSTIQLGGIDLLTLVRKQYPGYAHFLAGAIERWMPIWMLVYPALLGLATLAALAMSWYLLNGLSGSSPGPAPVREFRFSDHLVWVLVVALALIALPIGEFAARVGENAVLLMGGLYLLRGLAVLMWLGGAFITSGWVAALWAVIALVAYPVATGVALVLGLSDTWLDVRGRMRRVLEAGGDGKSI